MRGVQWVRLRAGNSAMQEQLIMACTYCSWASSSPTRTLRSPTTRSWDRRKTEVHQCAATFSSGTGLPTALLLLKLKVNDSLLCGEAECMREGVREWERERERERETETERGGEQKKVAGGGGGGEKGGRERGREKKRGETEKEGEREKEGEMGGWGGGERERGTERKRGRQKE